MRRGITLNDLGMINWTTITFLLILEYIEAVLVLVPFRMLITQE